MTPSLIDLPPSVLSHIFSALLSFPQDHRASLSTLLSGWGSRTLHASAVKFAYSTLTITDVHSVTPRQSQLCTVLSSFKYAHVVETVIFEQTEEMDEDSLSRVLSAIPNLRHLHWLSPFSPPQNLCLLLEKREIHTFVLSLASSYNEERWDASHFNLLPTTLRKLSVSSLSSEGSKNLAATDISFPFLEDLTLGNSLFIDDTLLASVGRWTSGGRLKNAKISTWGTKLTDKAVRGIMESGGWSFVKGGQLVLDRLEGRLSKGLWTSLADWPRTLTSLRIVFAEVVGHRHSWTTDHLASIFSLLSFPTCTLTHLSIIREVPPLARQPGNHALLPCDDRVAPRRMPKDDVLLILEKGGKLRSLEIDFWEISLEVLQAIMEKCVLLESLRVFVDAPFTKVLNNIPSSVYANLRALRTVTLSIPPRHTPFLANLPSDPDALAEVLTSNVPPSKDFRKALKKSSKLQSISWTGRGGVGHWDISHPPKGTLLKVNFEPLQRVNVTTVVDGPRRGSEISEGIGRRRSSAASATSSGFGWRKNRSLSMSTADSSLFGMGGESSPEKDFNTLPDLEEDGGGLGTVDENEECEHKEDKKGSGQARRKSSPNSKEKIVLIGQQRGRN